MLLCISISVLLNSLLYGAPHTKVGLKRLIHVATIQQDFPTHNSIPTVGHTGRKSAWVILTSTMRRRLKQSPRKTRQQIAGKTDVVCIMMPGGPCSWSPSLCWCGSTTKLGPAVHFAVRVFATHCFLFFFCHTLAAVCIM